MDHLWIIQKDSSSAMYYRNFTEIRIDPDLVSGLLGALNNFSEIEMRSQGIESISMGGLNWVYLDNKELHILVVAAESKRANSSPDLLRARLSVILNAFVAKFNITADSMQKSAFFVAEFPAFDAELDNIVEQWKEVEMITNAGELFDMLGVFQQILNLFMTAIQNQAGNVDMPQLLSELKSFTDSLQGVFDVQENAEFQKITFDEDRGWTVITLDPTKLTKALLKKGLFAILRHAKSVLVKHLGYEGMLNAIAQDILPYIFTSWDLLEILDLAKMLVMTLLERPVVRPAITDLFEAQSEA
jgi:hypothetical protein